MSWECSSGCGGSVEALSTHDQAKSRPPAEPRNQIRGDCARQTSSVPKSSVLSRHVFSGRRVTFFLVDYREIVVPPRRWLANGDRRDRANYDRHYLDVVGMTTLYLTGGPPARRHCLRSAPPPSHSPLSSLTTLVWAPLPT